MLERLFAARGIGNICYESLAYRSDGEGIDALGAYLNGVVSSGDFRREVKHIIILADSDDDQEIAFNRVVEKIEVANNTDGTIDYFPIPVAPYEAAQGDKTLTVCFLPGPNAEPGCLETLLLRYLRAEYGTAIDCVDGLLGCAGIDANDSEWGVSKLDKARLRAALAILCKRNPAVSVSTLWKSQKTRDLIKLDHAVFNDLADLFVG